MKRRKLPIGIQSFAKIRSDDYYYVDKTALALELIEGGSHYFLSRPRCFGKSLFLDTLKELFEGNEPLFKGLAAQKQCNWSVKYPVLRFSFGSVHYSSTQDLINDLTTQLNYFEAQFGITSQSSHPGARFSNLLQELHQTLGVRVVVLVDEYDKPILDALQDSTLARQNRDFLSF